MSLFVRQVAWLNATPKRPSNDASAGPPMTRLERMRKDKKDEGYEPELPPVQAAYLLEYLFEIGPALPGPARLTHEELRCWQDLTGVDLAPWEVRALRRLSRDYIVELVKAEKPDAKAPWDSGARPDVKAAATAMRDHLRRLATL